MTSWLTARELSGLPGMPTSEMRTRVKLDRLGIPSRAREGRGGGREFDCTQLPEVTRVALMLDRIAQAPAAIAAHDEAQLPAVAPDVPALADPQRKPPSQADKAVADSRVLLINHLLELEPLHGVKKAAKLLALQLACGDCSPELRTTARTANQRARDDSVSDRTLQRWLSIHRTQGWWGLLPAPAESPAPTEVGDDVAAVLGLYLSKDARFRNLTHAAQTVTKQLRRDYDSWKLLYAKARRALPHVNKVDVIKSRHSGSDAKSMLPHKRRDTTVLKPLDVAISDGHTFKAKVRHPDHGAPFAPEVTAYTDVATRRITGWSVSLSENVLAVGDALRHSVANVGVHAIYYSDNGAGQTAKQMDCPIAGIMARLGADHRTGIPGNPQGRGVIERSWSTWLIKCARQFGSYQGKDVDALTLRKAAAELASEQRALKRAEQTGEVIRLSTKAPTWQQFIDAVDAAVREYNATHRHRSLPKHASGPHAGKHMTPNEAWDAMFDRADEVHRLSQLELRMLFMPAMVRTAKRGEVKFLNQVYASAELMAVDGLQVRVHYDIHDPSFVMVCTLEGEYVCEAKWNANRVDYFPKPVVQIAREKRVDARMKRLQGQMELAARELRPTHAGGNVFSLPEPDTPVVLVPSVEVFSSSLPPVQPTQAQPAQATAGRPFFDNASERYEWLMQRRGDWSEDDGAWIAQYVGGEDYAALADYFASRGLEWKDEGEGFKSAR